MDFKVVYKAKDGTTFDTKAEVEAYIKLLETPHVKKLVERVEKLEQELLALKAEVAAKTWFSDVRTNKPPFQQPMFSEPLPNYTAQNPAKKD